MTSDGSVTRWVRDLQAGDGAAAGHLWDRFFHRMRGLARARAVPHGMYDEEDVALSAFAGFCRAAQEGDFARLQDRDELWRLLTTITVNKAHERARAEAALKRGGTRQAEEADFDALPSSLLPPDLLAMMTEECQRLMGLLGDTELETVAMMRLEGYGNDEIAEQLGCTRRTVQRMLAIIRQLWGEA